MKILATCLFALFTLATLNAQENSENSYVKLSVTEGNISGSAFGPNVLQYHGRYLKDLFRVIDPKYAFEIDDKTLRRTKFTLEVLGDLDDKTWIIEEMNKILSNEGYEVTRTRRHPRIFKLTCSMPQNCGEEGKVNSGESQYNQKWEGKCVKLSRVMEKLHEWHPQLLIEVPEDSRVSVVKMEKSTVKDLQRQLANHHVKMEVDDELSLREYITVYR